MSSMLGEQSCSYLFGSNASFVEDLYEKYLNNSNDVGDKWKKYFDSIQDGITKDRVHFDVEDKFASLTQVPFSSVRDAGITEAQIKIWQLIENYRMVGVDSASLDPLKRLPITKSEVLDIKKNGLESELENEFYVGFDTKNSIKLKLKDIIAKYDAIYCGDTGFEYVHITNLSEHKWMQNYIENKFLDFKLTVDEKKKLLLKLTEAEGLEKFLNTKFVGQKRFSLEGGESLIPALDRVITKLSKTGIKEIYIGMAHRGRLNVLVNINGKPPQKLYDEFEGNDQFNSFVTSGDVKYHKGYKCNYTTDSGPVKVTTLFNPSHLETVNSVLNGVVRARQDKLGEEAHSIITGIVIHGDAALIGLGTNQGVLNMSNTRAYGVGGVIHIVINNQIGFTTSDTRDARSSRFCTDLAKMIEAPIIHVNADDVERVMFAMDLAVEYRQLFNKDIMIDLVCFRRYGHNEADDPTLTQPFMYKKVKVHPGTRRLYIDSLVGESVLKPDEADDMFELVRNNLNEGKHIEADKLVALPWYSDFDTSPILNLKPFEKVASAISLTAIKKITEVVTTLPNKEFKLHPTLQRVVVESRKQMGEGELGIDFGMAETLAYGSMLDEGISIRICGEDSGRGTFSHRHAVWHNFERTDITDTGYIPLKKLENNSKFYIYDSVLNEECALGFEYGYGITNLADFVMWEAQFGDFANGAQVIIDQFISSAEVKWGILCNVTMMLPHGFDGQGPEHSSARLERFLQLCAENNMQVVIPSTAAQMFHVIRYKALSSLKKPLIIFMSKRLLRYKDAASSLVEITDGEFKFVIDDKTTKSEKVYLVLLCSGQIYYDLVNTRKTMGLDETVAIIRLEQLYPFPIEQLKAVLSKFKGCKFTWVQEEPYNQGAWLQIRDFLEKVIEGGIVGVVSRSAAAAPACGLSSMHEKQLKELLKEAFN